MVSMQDAGTLDEPVLFAYDGSDLAARAKKIFVDRVLDSVETLIEQRRRAR